LFCLSCVPSFVPLYISLQKSFSWRCFHPLFKVYPENLFLTAFIVASFQSRCLYGPINFLFMVILVYDLHSLPTFLLPTFLLACFCFVASLCKVVASRRAGFREKLHFQKGLRISHSILFYSKFHSVSFLVFGIVLLINVQFFLIFFWSHNDTWSKSDGRGSFKEQPLTVFSPSTLVSLLVERQEIECVCVVCVWWCAWRCVCACANMCSRGRESKSAFCTKAFRSHFIFLSFAWVRGGPE
jgi:hypothetical protein